MASRRGMAKAARPFADIKSLFDDDGGSDGELPHLPGRGRRADSDERTSSATQKASFAWQPASGAAPSVPAMRARREELLAMEPDDVPRAEWKALIAALDAAVRAQLGLLHAEGDKHGGRQDRRDGHGNGDSNSAALGDSGGNARSAPPAQPASVCAVPGCGKSFGFFCSSVVCGGCGKKVCTGHAKTRRVFTAPRVALCDLKVPFRGRTVADKQFQRMDEIQYDAVGFEPECAVCKAGRDACGGYMLGDAVIANGELRGTGALASSSVALGDVGRVVELVMSGEHKGEVVCAFPNYARLRCSPGFLHPGKVLADGLRPGTTVTYVSKEHTSADGHIRWGDVCVVVGPAHPSMETAWRCVRVRFPPEVYKSVINVGVGQLMFCGETFCGKFRRGDTARSVKEIVTSTTRRVFPAGTMATISGPCFRDDASVPQLHMPSNSKVRVMLGGTDINVPTDFVEWLGRLPEGFAIGDRVQSTDALELQLGGVIRPGEVGRVVRPGGDGVMVLSFDTHGLVNVSGGDVHDFAHVEIAGNFAKNDRVEAVAAFQTPRGVVQRGVVGRVTGPGTTAVNPGQYVQCHWPNGADVNMHAATQIRHATLDGGFRKGDAVVSLVTDCTPGKGGTVAAGDVGVVRGAGAGGKGLVVTFPNWSRAECGAHQVTCRHMANATPQHGGVTPPKQGGQQPGKARPPAPSAPAAAAVTLSPSATLSLDRQRPPSASASPAAASATTTNASVPTAAAVASSSAATAAAPVARFTDYGEPASAVLAPIHGLCDDTNNPLVDITDAVRALPGLDMEGFLWSAKKWCRSAAGKAAVAAHPALSDDAAMAVWLYTAESPLYAELNRHLRSENREALRAGFFPYARLLFEALRALAAPEARMVSRGVRGALPPGEYAVGDSVVWWGFSSCTAQIDVLRSPQFLGTSGPRTIFQILTRRGVDVSGLSAIKREREVLLPAGTALVVTGRLHPEGESGLTIITLEDDADAPDLVR